MSVREHAKTLIYRYRVSFKHRKAEAAALGLKKRLWDTLIGDDSAFVRWDMATQERKKKTLDVGSIQANTKESIAQTPGANPTAAKSSRRR